MRRSGRAGPSSALAVLALVGTAGAVAWVVAAGRTERPGRVARLEQRGGAPGSGESGARLVAGAARAAEPSRASSVVDLGDAARGEPSLTVLVRTRRALWSDDIVPDVAVELSLWPAHGVLTTVSTDGRGEARVEVPRRIVESARERAPELCLVARVVERGFQKAKEAKRVPAALEANGESGELVLIVPAQRGDTIVGRLLDAEGEPCPGYVHLWAPSKSGMRPSVGSSARANGHFELQVRVPGPYDLLATSEDRGSAALRGLVLGGEERGPIELRLAGEGVVRGRVERPDGGPAPALPLFVLAEELEREDRTTSVPDMPADRLRFEARGEVKRHVETAADGTFEVRGLRPGRYVVRTIGAKAGPFPTKLTETPVASDGREVVLRYDAPWLVVRVREARGEVIAGLREIAATASRRPSASWPSEAVVAVAPLSESSGLDLSYRGLSSSAFLSGRALDEGALVYEVAAGARYQVGLIGGEQAWSPLEVDVPIGVPTVEVMLEPHPDPGRGALVVSALGLDDEPLEWNVVVRIAAEADGLPLVEARPKRDAWPFRVELPAGRYRVQVEQEAGVEFYHGSVLSSRELGRFETLVAVPAGAEERVEARLPIGARLRVALRGAVDDNDREAVAEHFEGLDPRSWSVEHWATHAALTLVPSSGWPLPVMFEVEIDGNRIRLDRLPLPSEALAEVLPAGRFVLEARMPGGRVASAPVELVAGETAKIELRFE